MRLRFFGGVLGAMLCGRWCLLACWLGGWFGVGRGRRGGGWGDWLALCAFASCIGSGSVFCNPLCFALRQKVSARSRDSVAWSEKERVAFWFWTCDARVFLAFYPYVTSPSPRRGRWAHSFARTLTCSLRFAKISWLHGAVSFCDLVG